MSYSTISKIRDLIVLFHKFYRGLSKSIALSIFQKYIENKNVSSL